MLKLWRFVPLILLAGCGQDHPVEPTHMRIAWDSDGSPVIVAEGFDPRVIASSTPGTVWMLYYYPNDLPPFVCRQEGGWRGLVEVRVTPDSIYHPAGAERHEEDCRVVWSNHLRVDGLAPTEGRVRLESVRLIGETTNL